MLAVNTSVFHRRRAERFAQLLDEANGARRHHVRSEADRELTDLVEVGQRLSRIDLGVRADPEFRDGLRAMLMATIEREGIGATAVAPEAGTRPIAAGPKIAWVPVRSRRARGAVVVGLAVGTLAISGMSAASGDAKPGDALYGMKRSAERAQLALSGSQQGRGQLNLEFAKTRISEAVTGRGDVVTILDDMDTETREGVRLLTTAAIDGRDPASLDVVDAFVAEQRHAIAGLLDTVIGDARTRTIGSLQLLDQVSTRVHGLRTAISCGNVANLGTDPLGPVPGVCITPGPSSESAGKAPDNGSKTPRGTTGTPESGTATPATPASNPGNAGTATPAPSGTPMDAPQSDATIVDRIMRMLGGG
ncbi:hypothetical protein Pme01_09360 [Planosporangium mesophilum]|uniref:DUF5667 domain-containing protein n=1 Tax=Planosporangium mesophilum TaxID=689768 RepID=A0A8J3T7M1_9ACTN|nr:hypothetical protein Pme01_09360 [Planosporangium mesophilum]